MNKDEKLEVFNDGYLKNLCYETIAELAKKSIRLTAENRRLEEALEEIKEVWEKDKDGDYDFVKWQILNIISKTCG